MSNVEEAFQTLKQYIRSTHIHDNKREKDTHLFPGEGNIDWKQAMTLLRQAPHVPPIMLEIDGEGRKDIWEKFPESFRMLETR
jgi:sugar phosphate isomerase/epimerase